MLCFEKVAIKPEFFHIKIMLAGYKLVILNKIIKMDTVQKNNNGVDFAHVEKALRNCTEEEDEYVQLSHGNAFSSEEEELVERPKGNEAALGNEQPVVHLCLQINAQKELQDENLVEADFSWREDKSLAIESKNQALKEVHLGSAASGAAFEWSLSYNELNLNAAQRHATRAGQMLTDFVESEMLPDIPMSCLVANQGFASCSTFNGLLFEASTIDAVGTFIPDAEFDMAEMDFTPHDTDFAQCNTEVGLLASTSFCSEAIGDGTSNALVSNGFAPGNTEVGCGLQLDFELTKELFDIEVEFAMLGFIE